jgi:hypothetical protein
MKRASALVLLLAACASDKYVHVQAGDGRSLYARREEVEKVDAKGMIDVENVLTGKRVSLRRADCVIRGASRSEVTRARGNHFVYEQ